MPLRLKSSGIAAPGISCASSGQPSRNSPVASGAPIAGAVGRAEADRSRLLLALRILALEDRVADPVGIAEMLLRAGHARRRRAPPEMLPARDRGPPWPERSVEAGAARRTRRRSSSQVASSSGTGVPSACIWALSVTRMWTSPPLARRDSRPDPNSCRLFSLRIVAEDLAARRHAVDVFVGHAAQRPRRHVERAQAAIGEGDIDRRPSAAAPGAGRSAQLLAVRRPAHARSVIAVAERLDEGAPLFGIGDADQPEAAERKAELP